MNFHYIFTIFFCAIFIMASIIVKSNGDYSTDETLREALQQQLNIFGNTTYNSNNHLKILAMAERNFGEHGNRKRRHALELQNIRPTASIENEIAYEEPIVTKCNPDFCKAQNCAGVWRSDRSKYFLKPSKEVDNFLNTLKQENEKMPREVSVNEEGEQSIDEENAEESEKENESHPNQQKIVEDKKQNQVDERKKRFKGVKRNRFGVKRFKTKKNYHSRSGGNIIYHTDNSAAASYPENEPNSEFSNEANIIKTKQLVDHSNTDLSSCQHCSEHLGNGKLKNNYKYMPKKGNPNKVQEVQPFLKFFKQKYSIGDYGNSEEEDEANDEDDNLFRIKGPSSIVVFGPETTPNPNKKPAGNATTPVKLNTTSTYIFPTLNDQFESSPNNLSHEANYKLSKDEQDASENKKDYSWKWGIFKRSHNFNAMNEIKLKTSKRLMDRGLGASLPSYSLGDIQKEMYIDNLIKEKEKEMLREKNGQYNSFDDMSDEMKDSNKQIEDMTMPPTDFLTPLHRHDYRFTRAKNNDRTYRTNFIDGQDMERSLSSFSNCSKGFLADSDYISKYKSFKRKKRSTHMPDVAKQKMTNKEKKPETIPPYERLYGKNGKSSDRMLPRNKRFNPIKALDLEIYKKFHNPRNKNYNHRQIKHRRKKHKKFKGRIRIKRSPDNFLYMAKSSAGSDNWLKAFTKNLFKNGQNLQKLLKAFLINKLKTFNAAKLYKIVDEDSFNDNEQLANRKHKNKSSKQDFKSRDYKDNTGYKKVPTERSLKSLDNFQTKHLQNRNNSYIKIKSNNSRPFKKFRILKPPPTTTLKSFLKVLPKKINFSNKLAKTSKCQDSPAALLSDYFGIKKIQFEREETKQKLSFKDDLKKKYKNKKARRVRRSLEESMQTDRLESNNTEKITKRSTFPNYSNLFNPDYKMDLPYLKPNPLGNEFYDPAKVYFTPPSLNAKETVNPTTEYNFVSFHTAYSGDEFDGFKKHSPEIKQFEGMKFDNLWYDNKLNKGGHRTRKRFSKTSNISRKLKQPAKRYTFIINNNKKTAPKTSKLPAKIQILKDKYLIDLQNFNKNYKFNAHDFKWPTTHLKNSNKMRAHAAKEILNCKTYDSLEEFIKSLPKNLTDSLLNGNAEQPHDDSGHNNENSSGETNTPANTEEHESNTGPTLLDQSISCTTGSGEENPDEGTKETSEDATEHNDMDMESSTESSEHKENEHEIYTENTLDSMTTESSEGSHDDIKLNITIHANVHANADRKKVSGHGSFDISPGVADQRQRRSSILSPIENVFKRKQLQTDTNQKLEEAAETKTASKDLHTSHFSSNIVKEILKTVQENPKLRVLWPSLKVNQYELSNNQPNFYAIKNKQNEKQINKAENLINEAMTSINQLIEQRVRAQACVPLSPDLQEFYNMIIQSRRAQDMVREKRQFTSTRNSEDFSYKLHLLDPNKIEDETKIVKKLLKDYEELPREDQQKLAVARDDLFKNLIILRQLQDKEEQNNEELREKREYELDKGDEQVMESLKSRYTPEFLKLLNAAELYREINSS